MIDEISINIFYSVNGLSINGLVPKSNTRRPLLYIPPLTYYTIFTNYNYIYPAVLTVFGFYIERPS